MAPVNLRKYVPHPVRLFSPTSDLGKCLLVVVFLRYHEAIEYALNTLIGNPVPAESGDGGG